MKPNIVLQPYSMSSEGAKELYKALKSQTPNVSIKAPGFIPQPNDVVINWGCGFHTIDNPHNVKIFNPNHLLKQAINKLVFFKHLDNYKGVSKVPFFTNKQDAMDHLANKGGKVYCRTRLSKSAGRGIVIAKTPQEVVDAALYTVGMPNTHEYRIQMFHDRVISELEKRMRKDAVVNHDIRTDKNGWYYKKDIDVPPVVISVACNTIKALGLDFGGVDIIYDKHTNKAWTLEVNTAPGLKERSASLYASAIMQAVTY